MTKNDCTSNGPIEDNANQASQGKREQFVRELIHEFTNTVTAVIGYSELALHEMECSHPAREWLEKIKNHTKRLASLIRKLTALSSGTKQATKMMKAENNSRESRQCKVRLEAPGPYLSEVPSIRRRQKTLLSLLHLVIEAVAALLVSLTAHLDGFLSGANRPG